MRRVASVLCRSFRARGAPPAAFSTRHLLHRLPSSAWPGPSPAVLGRRCLSTNDNDDTAAVNGPGWNADAVKSKHDALIEDFQWEFGQAGGTDHFMQTYYTQPNPDFFVPALVAIAATPIVTDDRADPKTTSGQAIKSALSPASPRQAAYLAFFASLMRQHPERVTAWFLDLVNHRPAAFGMQQVENVDFLFRLLHLVGLESTDFFLTTYGAAISSRATGASETEALTGKEKQAEVERVKRYFADIRRVPRLSLVKWPIPARATAERLRARINDSRRRRRRADATTTGVEAAGKEEATGKEAAAGKGPVSVEGTIVGDEDASTAANSDTHNNNTTSASNASNNNASESDGVPDGDDDEGDSETGWLTRLQLADASSFVLSQKQQLASSIGQRIRAADEHERNMRVDDGQSSRIDVYISAGQAEAAYAALATASFVDQLAAEYYATGDTELVRRVAVTCGLLRPFVRDPSLRRELALGPMAGAQGSPEQQANAMPASLRGGIEEVIADYEARLKAAEVAGDEAAAAGIEEELSDAILERATDLLVVSAGLTGLNATRQLIRTHHAALGAVQQLMSTTDSRLTPEELDAKVVLREAAALLPALNRLAFIRRFK